jgi:hypothetical protein
VVISHASHVVPLLQLLRGIEPGVVSPERPFGNSLKMSFLGYINTLKYHDQDEEADPDT